MYKLVRKNIYEGIEKSDKIWFFVLTLLMIPITYSAIIVIKHDNLKRDHSGYLIRKYEERLKNKNGDEYDIRRNFIVKFDSIEKPIEIGVTANTYFSIKEKQRVTFQMKDGELGIKTTKFKILSSITIISFLIIDFIFLIYIINIISSLCSDYKIVNVRKQKRLLKKYKMIDPYGEENWDN